MFLKLMTVAFITVFAENTIFSRAFGTSTLILVSKRRSKLLMFGACLTIMTVFTCFIAYFENRLLVGLSYAHLLMPMIYVSVIGIVYIAALLLMWKFSGDRFDSIKKYVHLSAFNCAVLGALFLSDTYADTLIEYLVYGLGTSIGFLLAAYLLVIVYDKLCSKKVPISFRGFPLIMAYIGILGMAFYGLLGHRLSF